MTMADERKGSDRAALDAWKEAPVVDLIRHLMEHYHWETRHGMAELENLVEEAALMEGHHFPQLLAIRDEVDLFCREMRDHLRMEEATLFPAILAKEQGREFQMDKEIMEPLELFEDEHNAAAGLLVRIHKLTEGFQPPESAQGLQRRLYRAFEVLADSLMQHIYLENEVLFKRVL
ncbi:MAG: scdA [Holophagaceae bacterium]|nr:scdA [Holophagaceae bacterium]